MYLPRLHCAHVSRCYPQNEMLYELRFHPRNEKSKSHCWAPARQWAIICSVMHYYIRICGAYLLFMYVYTTRVDTSSPGVLQSIKCNLCGMDNFFRSSPNTSLTLFLFVTYPTSFILYSTETINPFFFFFRTNVMYTER